MIFFEAEPRSATVHTSECGTYTLVVESFSGRGEHTVLTRGTVSMGDAMIARIHCNYSHFYFAFVLGHPHGDALHCARDHFEDVLVDLATGEVFEWQRTTRRPDRWLFIRSPTWCDDHTMLHAICYEWGNGSDHVLAYDARDLFSIPWPLVHVSPVGVENPRWDGRRLVYSIEYEHSVPFDCSYMELTAEEESKHDDLERRVLALGAPMHEICEDRVVEVSYDLDPDRHDDETREPVTRAPREPPNG